MENQFFMPIGKQVTIQDTNDAETSGCFEGFVTFGGIPSIFLTCVLSETDIRQVIIPINQVVSFDVVKPKNILL